MDDLFSAILGLMLLGIALYVAVIVAIAIVSVVAFTTVLVAAPSIAASFFVLRALSVDFRQAWYKFKQLNFAYYTALLLPGAFFTYHTYETGQIHPLLFWANVAVWATTAIYCLWLLGHEVMKWDHRRQLPDAKNFVTTAGTVDVEAIAASDPSATLYTRPVDWQSEDYERVARKGSEVVTGRPQPTVKRSAPVYRTAAERDAKAAASAIREWGDLFENAGKRAEEESYRQTMQKAETR